MEYDDALPDGIPLYCSQPSEMIELLPTSNGMHITYINCYCMFQQGSESLDPMLVPVMGFHWQARI